MYLGRKAAWGHVLRAVFFWVHLMFDPTKDEKQTLATSQEWYSNAERNRTQWDRGKWLRFYKISQGYLPDKDDEIADTYPTRSRRFCKEAHTIIWTKVAAFEATLSGSKSIIEFEPIGTTDIDMAREVTKFENYRLVQVARLKEQLTPVGIETLVYGTGFLKALWNEKKKGLDLFPVSIFAIYVDPYAKNIEDAHYIIHRELIPMSLLKRLEEQGHFENIDNIEDEGMLADSTDWNQEKMLSIDLSVPSNDLSTEIDPDNKMVEVREYWTQTHTWAIAGDKTIIRKAQEHKLPRIPIFRVPCYPNPHEFYGRSEIEIVEQELLDLTLWRNLVGDSAMLITMPAFFVDTNANIDPDDTILSPGHQIPYDGSLTNRNKPIERVDAGSLPSDAYNMIAIIENQIEKASGVTDLQAGIIEPTGNPTATEIRVAQGQGSQRTNLQLKFFRQNIVEPLAQYSFELDKKLLPDDYVFRVLEDGRATANFQKMSPLTLEEVDINFIASGAPMLGNLQLFAQNTLNFLSMCQQFQVKCDFRQGMRDVGQAMEISNLDDILSEGPPIGQDPQQENMAMSQDVHVPINQMDDHESHFEIHQQFVVESWPPDDEGQSTMPENLQMLFGQHIIEHQQMIAQSGGGVNIEQPRELSPNAL